MYDRYSPILPSLLFPAVWPHPRPNPPLLLPLPPLLLPLPVAGDTVWAQPLPS